MRGNKGFTLVVIAGLMAFIGALLFGMMTTSTTDDSRGKYKITMERLAAIRHQLQVYKENNYLNSSKYPCPARRDIAVSHADFGKEVADCATNLIVASNTVAIGAVPVKKLNLPDNYAFDGWGNYFTYMKDKDDAETITSTDLNGANNVIIPNYDFPKVDMRNVAAAVISHSENMTGAYNRKGQLVKACTGTGKDVENCDQDIQLIYDYWDENQGYDDIIAGLRL